MMQCNSVFFSQEQLELLLISSLQGIHNWEIGYVYAKIGCKRHILCQKWVGNGFVSTANRLIYILMKAIFLAFIFVMCMEVFDPVQ